MSDDKPITVNTLARGASVLLSELGIADDLVGGRVTYTRAPDRQSLQPDLHLVPMFENGSACKHVPRGGHTYHKNRGTETSPLRIFWPTGNGYGPEKTADHFTIRLGQLDPAVAYVALVVHVIGNGQSLIGLDEVMLALTDNAGAKVLYRTVTPDPIAVWRQSFNLVTMAILNRTPEGWTISAPEEEILTTDLFGDRHDINLDE